MENVLICDSTNNRLLIYDLKKSKLRTIFLEGHGESFGAHDLTIDQNRIYVVNSQNNSIIIINKNTFEFQESFYAGSIPTSIHRVADYIFIACEGTNSVDVISKDSLELLVTIPVRNYPHDIAYSSKNNTIFTANFMDSSISIIDAKDLKEIGNIKSKYYPTRILISEKHNCIISCESCLGDKQGFIEIFSLETLKPQTRIPVGINPLNICIDRDILYVSNFNDGTISILNLITKEIQGHLYIGGSLGPLCKLDNYLCIGDRKNCKLVLVNLEACTKRTIALGGEPNAIKFLL